MLIRLIIKNFYSFRDETEFNLFPNKSQSLEHHKVKSAGFSFLRYSAIYGANGSGKSNLIKALAFLKSIVVKGKVPHKMYGVKFMLADDSLNLPVSLGIEFIAKDKPFFYTISFDDNRILYEYLAESTKDTDVLIFERNSKRDEKEIKFNPDYYKTDKEKLFVEVLSEKLILDNELLISFLSKKYPEEFKLVRTAFEWFTNTLVVIKPDAKPGGIAHIMDTQPFIKEFANDFIARLNTGVSKIEIEKRRFEDLADLRFDAKYKKQIIDDLRENPHKISVVRNSDTGEELSIVCEDDEVVTKRLITKHQNILGVNVDFNLGQESDGTKRFIDYIPALQGVINDYKVYVIDEIERSIHPMTIKKIMKELTAKVEIKGQLIFSTHESNLLDQSIFRPDEIWLTEKDIGGSTNMYSLSDFKIHNTISIENGYLKGRFGGIPFLGDLNDLKWEDHEVLK